MDPLIIAFVRRRLADATRPVLRAELAASIAERFGAGGEVAVDGLVDAGLLAPVTLHFYDPQAEDVVQRAAVQATARLGDGSGSGLTRIGADRRGDR